jgi:2-polyprenyl-3-methyl-5-hydroxy-6-metoxy-1,4-benzoquinol methylase
MVGRRLLRPWPLLRILARARRTALWTELKPLLTHQLFATLYSRNRNAVEMIKDAGNSKINPQPPALFLMATGYWLSQAIYVAAKLGLADLLKDGPKSCSALAAATGADEQSLFRLMRALSSTEVFAHLQDDYFALSRSGESLQSHVPGSLRAIVMTLGEIHYHAWGDLLQSVRTGSPAFNNVFGTGLFDYLQRDAEAADAFNDGMTDLSSLLAYAVLMAYDFSGISSIVDIGGGQGKLLQSIVQLNPGIKGTLFDLESAIEIAKQHLSSDACSGRCSAVAGDFFNSVPEGANAYILCGVIHDWNDDRSIRILKNCRTAMAKTGRLLLVEMVVPEPGANCFSKLLDLNMLVMTGGRERTKAEFTALLDAAGYKLTRIVPTIAPQCVIEAIPS